MKEDSLEFCDAGADGLVDCAIGEGGNDVAVARRQPDQEPVALGGRIHQRFAGMRSADQQCRGQQDRGNAIGKRVTATPKRMPDLCSLTYRLRPAVDR